MSDTCNSQSFVRKRLPLTILLLNSEKFEVTVDKTDFVGKVFLEVCEYLDLDDPDIFGLARSTETGFFFLESSARISTLCASETPSSLIRRLSLVRTSKKCASSGCNSELSSYQSELPILHFAVRFYIPNHCLRGKRVKHLYYQQLKRNFLSYGLLCSDEIYFELASFALQAEHGVTIANALNRRIPLNETEISLTDYFPSWLIDEFGKTYLYRSLPGLVETVTDVPRDALEFRFMRLASEASSNFNLHLFQVSPFNTTPLPDLLGHTFSLARQPQKSAGLRRSVSKCSRSGCVTSGCGSFWLGLSPFGLEFHEEYKNRRISNSHRLHWNEIIKLSFKRNCFLVYTGDLSKQRPEPVIRNKLTFYTVSSLEAQHLFTLASQMHLYQTTARLSSNQSVQQIELDERRQYNESYIYSEGEVVASARIHGVPDGRNSRKFIPDDFESPHFPEVSQHIFFSSRTREPTHKLI